MKRDDKRRRHNGDRFPKKPFLWGSGKDSDVPNALSARTNKPRFRERRLCKKDKALSEERIF